MEDHKHYLLIANFKQENPGHDLGQDDPKNQDKDGPRR